LNRRDRKERREKRREKSIGFLCVLGVLCGENFLHGVQLPVAEDVFMDNSGYNINNALLKARLLWAGTLAETVDKRNRSLLGASTVRLEPPTPPVGCQARG
jgi:hypothetical protein